MKTSGNHHALERSRWEKIASRSAGEAQHARSQTGAKIFPNGYAYIIGIAVEPINEKLGAIGMPPMTTPKLSTKAVEPTNENLEPSLKSLE